jgi:hypothetical protein
MYVVYKMLRETPYHLKGLCGALKTVSILKATPLCEAQKGKAEIEGSETRPESRLNLVAPYDALWFP